jgi:peptidoglycan/LPS O-acetylase OafA/YrhL
MTKMGPGFFRLFLSFVVVFHHSFPLRLGAWGVYVFFILSGFWICRMWRQRYVQTHQPVLTFIISRWWRLAPVFLICTVLSVGSSFLLGEAGALQRASNPIWWVRQLLIAGSNQVGTNLPPTWSLDVEMQFYLVAPFLIALFERIRPAFRWMIIAAASGWLILFTLRGEDIQHAQLALFVSFFLIGVSIAMGDWKPSRSTALSSLIFFFCYNVIPGHLPADAQRRLESRTRSRPNNGGFPVVRGQSLVGSRLCRGDPVRDLECGPEISALRPVAR